MDQEILEKYKKAGRICAEVKESAVRQLKPGAKLADIAEFIESEIIKLGGRPAFPVNISINEFAAHCTPGYNDQAEIKPGDLLKIDIGAHVDGYIGDLAFTYCPEKNTENAKLINAAETLLESAIKIIKPGITVGEISRAIEEKSKELEVGLIVNLTGHTLNKFDFHGEPAIPNIGTDSGYEFKEGDVIALEPFTCKTNGFVKDSSPVEIFRFLMDRPVRMPEARQILAMARDEFNSLPFAKRWLYKKLSPIKVALALKQLEEIYAIESYPALKEKDGKPIAQAEHTIIVAEKPVVTTKKEE